jgi:hypothetical protein
VGDAQHSASVVSTKLNLTCGMCGEHFVEPEIEIFVAEFIHERRQMNRASIVDARLVRNSREWSNVDFASGKRLDIQMQQVLDCIESKTGAAAVQCFVTATCFEREIAATSTRV